MTRLVNIKVPRETRRALNILAAQAEVPVAEVVRVLVERPGVSRAIAAARRQAATRARPRRPQPPPRPAGA